MTDYTPLHLDWPGCLNVRDLGGLPLTGGGTVRERTLVRSESPSFLTDDGVVAATAYGFSRIIDLRRPEEIEQYPSRLAELPAHLHVPVQAAGDPEEGPWVHLYTGLLDRRPELFARAVGAVADAPEGPVLVHCAAGKDRTGLVVALALSLVGADLDALADDYEITNQRLAPRYAARAADREVLAGREIPPTRHVIVGAMEHLRTQHGSVEAYLSRGGLTPGHIRALRSRLIG
ncbi:tyrosine-protein phosphatase [Promicromonospora iranensis]|uniref:Protein tyrosine/serine phosphatase n=1 Tax=Promicromonospora iranensis TaxID=1105144 RepID=A0ABU2CVH0_9MICO|nr:tyrosine-protein phosphatase [Promicromonospora iranensis]MDR7385335.1 protein tyrosine/serine phosphatase [Promicromonospora iranensis]